MLTHNQEKLLQSLYVRQSDVTSNIIHTEEKLHNLKDELRVVISAIANLEADRESI